MYEGLIWPVLPARRQPLGGGRPALCRVNDPDRHLLLLVKHTREVPADFGERSFCPPDAPAGFRPMPMPCQGAVEQANLGVGQAWVNLPLPQGQVGLAPRHPSFPATYVIMLDS